MKTRSVRKVDELGRVVLPIEIRRALDIGEKSLLSITMEGDSVVLRRCEPSCVFCKSEELLAAYKGKNVCAACIRSLADVK